MNLAINLLLLLNVVFTNHVQCASISDASAKKCPTKRVDTYVYTCDLAGWVQTPDLISKTKTPTQLNCADKCLSNSRCKSFRYVQKSWECYLYYRKLDDMNTIYNNYQPGVLFNRDCFSNNCNVIAACQALVKGDCLTTLSIRNGYYGLYEWEHVKYACAYGRTARPRQYPFKQLLFPGKLATCDVIDRCANRSLFGTFDVHYHLPSQKWVCINYNEDYGYPEYGNPGYGPVTANRYQLRNSTVGVGYGFYLDYYEYPD